MKSHSRRFLRGNPSAALSVSPEQIAARAGSAALDHLLFGPNERLDGDAAPGGRRSAEGEIWFSACEGSAVMPRGHAAAENAYARIVGGSARPLPIWFEDLRRRLTALFGAPACEAVLFGSVAEAEQAFGALADAALARPVRHIAAAAPERPGEPDPDFAALPLRDRYGLAREAGQVDADAALLAQEAIAEGRHVALHVADCSETGLAGPTRAAAEALATSFPGRICVLIDARQLRCGPDRIAGDLAAGFAVLLSGSTFAGGPSGATALLLPGAFVERIGRFELPQPPAACSAATDWPPRLRDRRRDDFATLADLGVGLRWECALAELEAYFAIAPDLRTEIGAGFGREIRRHLAAAPALKLIDCGWRAEDARTIFPILTFDEHGRALKAEALRRALTDPSARRGGWTARGRPVHLGAPLRIGAMKALRLSLSAPLVNGVADRIREGRSFAAAFQPLADDLLETFGLWSELAAPGSL